MIDGVGVIQRIGRQMCSPYIFHTSIPFCRAHALPAHPCLHFPEGLQKPRPYIHNYSTGPCYDIVMDPRTWCIIACVQVCIIAAAMTTRSPFVSPLEKRAEADAAKVGDERAGSGRVGSWWVRGYLYHPDV